MLVKIIMFKSIHEEVLKKKTFSQLSKYIMNKNLIRRVKKYLIKINCKEVSAKIILASYLIRYQSKIVLSNIDIDKELVQRIVELHKILESDLENNIKENNIKKYKQFYKEWKEIDLKNQINMLIKDCISLEIKYIKEEDELLNIEINKLREIYRESIYKLGGQESIEKLEKEIKNIDQIIDILNRDVRYTVKKAFTDYIRMKIKDNNMDVVTDNLEDLKEMLICCVDDVNLNLKIDILNNLSIEYLSDEELYKYMLKILEYMLKISEESKKKDIKKLMTKLKINVIREKQMYKFVPELLNDIYVRLDELLINKTKIKNK